MSGSRVFHWMMMAVLLAVVGAVVWLMAKPDPLVGPLPPPQMLLPIEVDGLWGVMDESGTIVLEPIYQRLRVYRLGDEVPGKRISMPPMFEDDQLRPVCLVATWRWTDRREFVRSWPFYEKVEMLERVLFDADLQPRRTVWMQSETSGVRGPADSIPVIPAGDRYALATRTHIEWTEVPIQEGDWYINAYAGGVMVLEDKEETESRVFSPDGALAFTLPEGQYVQEVRGDRIAIWVKGQRQYEGEVRMIYDLSGKVLLDSGPHATCRFVTDDIVAVTGYTPIAASDGSPGTKQRHDELIHLPTGRTVSLECDEDGNVTVAPADQGVLVVEDQRATTYDSELKRTGTFASTGHFLRGSGGAIGAIHDLERGNYRWLRLVNTETGEFSDTMAASASLERPLRLTDDTIMRLEPDGTWALERPIYSEAPAPDGSGRLICVDHAGEQVGASFAADLRILHYILPEQTVCGAPILVLAPREEDGIVDREIILQIDGVSYSLLAKKAATTATDSIDDEKYSSSPMFWDMDRFQYTRTLVIIADNFGPWGRRGGHGPARYWAFDLATRTWWPEKVYVCEPVNDQIIRVILADHTWGYRRPDGTWIYRSDTTRSSSH